MPLFSRRPDNGATFRRPQPTADNRLYLLETSFDLLEGGFRRAETTRRVLIALTALTTAALLILVLWGMSAARTASESEATLATVAAQDAQTQAQLDAVDQAEGFTTDTLRSHTADRTAAYIAALAGEVDYSQLLRAIGDAQPAGLTVTSIDVTRPGLDTATSAGTGTDNTATGTDAAPTAMFTTASISVTTSNFADIVQFVDALRSTPGIAEANDPDPGTWGGGGDARTATVTVVVSNDLLSKRAQGSDLLDQYGIPVPAPEETP